MTKREFLPISLEECRQRGIGQLDFVYITGDAYVDHPSFGTAIISRVLEKQGYTVGILAQPDFRDPDSVKALGEPRLAFLVSAGNMDSMVNHYTVSKRRRTTDAYSPGGEMGKRPDRALIVYCNLLRRAFKKTPIILGGIEASLRRLAHYDYWSDSLKRSLLLDTGADMISYGMGERSIVEIADALDSSIPVGEITFVEGTVYRTDSLENIPDAVRLPDYQELLEDKKNYARSFWIQYQNTDAFSGKRLAEAYSSHCFVVQNPAAKPLSTEEMDAVYDLPYVGKAHPSYDKAGGVPATKEVRFSLTSSRGCFGGCSFCALTFHQGRIIQARSHESLLREAQHMTKEADFKGYIHDVGGPTANFRHPACKKQFMRGACRDRQCLFPKPCKNLDASHGDYRKLLKSLREIPGVRKVFIRSGIRFDYLLAEKSPEFLRELCGYHVSGQLKVAPEHISNQVLELMGKPRREVYDAFCKAYEDTNQKLGKKQFLVPYLMSSHPGSTLGEAVKLAEYCRDLGYMPEQVQDFYPTPSTLSTCMYYTGLDPRVMELVYVPGSPHEKAMQRALIQYRDPKNYDLVLEALKKAGRMDLVGYGKHCLIRPPKGEGKDASRGDKERQFGNGGGHLPGRSGGRRTEGNRERQDREMKKPGKKKTIRNVHKKKK